jgi:DNA-binding MarR family transcriptional regulator
MLYVTSFYVNYFLASALAALYWRHVKTKNTQMSEPTALRIWLQIAKASALIEQEITGKLREHYGQSLSRFDVLSQFDRTNGHEMSVGSLSKRLIASSGNISRLLDRMEKDGLLIRRHADTDRRNVYVSITLSGQNLFGDMARDHQSWITDMLAELPPERQQHLSELLKELQTALAPTPSLTNPTPDNLDSTYKGRS